MVTSLICQAHDGCPSTPRLAGRRTGPGAKVSVGLLASTLMTYELQDSNNKIGNQPFAPGTRKARSRWAPDGSLSLTAESPTLYSYCYNPGSAYKNPGTSSRERDDRH